jgi:predicted transcriptional regulator of viral defense system
MDKILLKFRRSGRSAFRTREYAALLGKPGYARLVLHRLKQRGEIVPASRGWWAFPDALPEAVACGVSQPCYVSFHSALFLHGLTVQTPRLVQLAVARNAKRYELNGLEVREYRVKKDRFNNFYRKDNILLASPEKAVADCLSAPRACPEMILSEVVGKVDTSMVKKLLGTKAAKMRLGKVMKC